MSHTWHKVLYAAKRRSRIPMHQDDGSELYLWKDLTQAIHKERRAGGRDGKAITFFFFFLLLSTIPMLAIMCQTNKSGGKKSRRTVLRATSWEVSEYESQTFALARCQRHSIHLSILDLSLSGGGAILVLFCERAPSSTYRMRFVPIKKIYVQQKPPFNVFNLNKSRCVTALRNFCFGSIPLHLFPWLFCALRARCIEGFDV